MKAQDNSFRLPALRLQPREYKFNLSQESIEQNQSKETIQQSVLNQYNPSPIRIRNKIMSMSVYNSQEKIKKSNQKQYLQNSDFITCQNTNNSISVQTVRRYRSKLKKMVQHNQNRSEINSRDPRYFFFKEPSATIKLTNLQEGSKPVDKVLEDRIKQLMSKVQMLMSSQSFYQQKRQQGHLNITMVKLQDEYDLLFQDFNEFYFSSRKIDDQVRNLLNHMQIIKQLLSPLQKPYHKYNKSTHSLHQNIFDMIVEESKESATQRVMNKKQQKEIFIEDNQNQFEVDENDDEDIYSQSQENEDDWNQMNKQNGTQQSQKKIKNKNSRSRIKQQGTNDTEFTSESQDNNIVTYDENGQQMISPNKRRRKVSQISNQNSQEKENFEEEQQQLEDGEQNVLNKKGKVITSKKRNTVRIEGQNNSFDDSQQDEEDNSKVIKEEEYSENENESQSSKKIQKKQTIHYENQSLVYDQFGQLVERKEDEDFEENKHIDREKEESEGIKSFRQERFVINHPNHEFNCGSMLDRFISLENIYDYKYLQSWNYHINKIRQARFFDEYDL